jgi:Ala-tRNA(Pro) deacylase
MKMVDLAKLEQTLKAAGITYELYTHRAIFTNEDALVIKEEQGFSGTETKSLFLKGKTGQYFIFVTFTTKRTNFKQISKLVGQRVSVVDTEEMKDLTGQEKGAVSPFGYEREIPLVIDEELFQSEKIVFAPGRPDRTMVLQVEDLPLLFSALKNPVYFYTEKF